MIDVLETATAANSARLRQRGHELPGARHVLAALQRIPGVVQAILSGNTRLNAYAKLSAFGLHGYLDFDVGGYGSDDDVRANLVGVAQRRASVKYGVSFSPAITVLVGDTPRDVRAGLNGGAHVVAVASGSDHVDTLREAGADVVLPDFGILRQPCALLRSSGGWQHRMCRRVDGGGALLPEARVLDGGSYPPDPLEALDVHVEEVAAFDLP